MPELLGYFFKLNAIADEQIRTVSFTTITKIGKIKYQQIRCNRINVK